MNRVTGLFFALAITAIGGGIVVDPIAVTGSGANYFDFGPSGSESGRLDFSGTDGVNAIWVDINNGCMLAGQSFSGFNICAMVSGSLNGVGYFDTVSYALGDDGFVAFTDPNTHLTQTVPVEGYFSEGPLIIENPAPDLIEQESITVLSIPEPGTWTTILAGCVALAGLLIRRARHPLQD